MPSASGPAQEQYVAWTGSAAIVRPSARVIDICRLRSLKKSSGPAGSITSSFSSLRKDRMSLGKPMPVPACQER